MTSQERHQKDETFEAYRDRHNVQAEEAMFLRSLGLNVEGEENDETKSVSDQVAEKIEHIFRFVDKAFEGHGIKDADITLNLRELLLKDLSPFLKKDKSSVSMMDISTLGLVDESKIRAFLQRHGVNLDRPAELQYALNVFREAVEFYDNEIARGKTPKIHKTLGKFSGAEDIYNLFQTSSGQGIRHLIPQACAILRIGMVIDFIQKDPLISHLSHVQGELKNAVHRHVRQVGNTFMYHSGDPQEKPIPLITAETRVKTRERIIMKLLHKPSNSTSEVLDHIGYRFVTESAIDTLRLIYQMFFDKNTAVLPALNIRVNKTKQSLVDPKILMAALKDAREAEELFAQLSEDTINHQDVDTESLTGTDNAHSSKNYRAIHLTIDFPVIINGLQQFFPIEIQFVDKTAHRDNDELAPHADYVEKQRQAASERVIGNNLHSNYQIQRQHYSKNGKTARKAKKVKAKKSFPSD